jgi:hypothetical protein
MTMETGQMTRFASLLIHYYLVTPAPGIRPDVAPDGGYSEEPHCPAGTRLFQRWTRRPDGDLAAGWHIS